MNPTKCLKIISNPNRLAILRWLTNPRVHFADVWQDGAVSSEDNSVCVGLIQKKSGLSQSATSQYLSQLESVGLIQATRKGNWIHYSLNSANMQEFLSWLQGNLTSHE